MKITDTLPPKGSGKSRMEVWWDSNGFQRIYKEFRKGTIPKVFLNKIADVRAVQDLFKLRGFQFGNWVNNEDRFNYLAALGICLYDLNKVLKFKANNLGLDNTLGVAFGARGKSRALAHYEPGTYIINMTRYYDNDRFLNPVPKAVRFVNSGGVGAFAHEYGHFLDYFFGARVEPYNTIYALTNGRSTNHKRINYDRKAYPLRAAVEDILELACKDKSKTKKSAYILRMEKLTDSDYFYRRNEIFARLFEQYIGYKLLQLDIKNSFLTQTKYSKDFYLTPTEMKKMAPLFDRMLVLMRMNF